MALIASILSGVFETGAKVTKMPFRSLAGMVSKTWDNLGTNGFKAALRETGNDLKAGKSIFQEFGKNFSKTKSGVFFKGVRTAGRGTLRVGFRNPIASMLTSNWIQYPAISMAAGTGLIYGAGRAAIERSNQRTMANANRGMPSNNLGTDGLTLALSRRRHM